MFIHTVLRHVSTIAYGYFEAVLKKCKPNTQTYIAMYFKYSRQEMSESLCIPYCNFQMLKFCLYIKFVLFKEREYKTHFQTRKILYTNEGLTFNSCILLCGKIFLCILCVTVHKLPKHGHIWPKRVAVVHRSVVTTNPLCCNRPKFVGSVQNGTPISR